MTELPGGVKIENWTSRTITLIAKDYGRTVDIPPEDDAPAMVTISHPHTEEEYIFTTEFLDSNLPDEEEGVYLIVTPVVKNAYPERHDLVLPICALRDKGVIVGYQGFSV